MKDELNLSDNQWHKMRKFLLSNKLCLQNFPPIYKLKEYRKEENQKIILKQNVKGFFEDLNEKIRFHVYELIQKLEIDSLNPKNAIKFKFTADKAFITRFRSLLNFAFSSLNDEDNCKSAKGHHLIGTSRR